MSLEAIIISLHLLYLLASWSRALFEKLPVLSQSRNSPHFIEPESSLPHSQVPATCPYPEPAQSSPYPQILLPEDPLIFVHSRINSMHEILLLRVCCNSEGEFDLGKEREHLCYINSLSGCYRRWLIVTDVSEGHTANIGSLMMRWDCSS